MKIHTYQPEWVHFVLDDSPHDIILNWLKMGSNRVFIRSEEVTYSYLDTLKLIEDKIQIIENHNIPKGSIIGVYSDNSVDNIISILAIIISNYYIYSPIFDPVDSICADFVLTMNTCIAFNKTATSILDKETRKKIAYLAYTSGTTGKRKTVLASKSNLASMLNISDKYFSGLFKNHILMFDLSFDGSLASIIWTIANSGVLNLVDKNVKSNSKELVKYIVKNNIDTILCLPKQYELILKESFSVNQCLKAVVLAGEYAPSFLYDEHLKTTSSCKLYNAYGTTETSIWNSIFLCDKKTREESIPIGFPMKNSSFSISSNNDDFDGELIISGPCVCIGYISGERFNGSYRTGDIVKKSYGYYTFMKRIPNYIKRNGVRIPSDDVVRDIYKLSYIDNCEICFESPFEVIVNRNDLSISENDRYKIIQDIYKSLAKNYNINQMPTKIHYGEIGHSFKKPNGQNNLWENIIETMFVEALGVNKINPNLSFFENGGDSLTAISLVSGISKYFNVTIDIENVFKCSKISSIIRYIHNDIDTPRNIIQFLREAPCSSKAIVIFPPAAGLPLFYSGLSGRINNINILSIMPPLKNIQNYKTISDYSLYCIDAITSLKNIEIILSGFSYGAYWALETCHQLERIGIPIKSLILIDAPSTYNKNINVDEQSNHFINFLRKNSTISMGDSNYIDTVYDKFKSLYKSQEKALCNYELPDSLKTPLFTLTCTVKSDDPLFIDGSYVYHWRDIKTYNFISDSTIDAKHEDLFNKENIQILSKKIYEIIGNEL